MTPSPLNRRDFLRAAAGLSSLGLLLPEQILADPYAAPTADPRTAPLREALRGRPVRVRGQVNGGGRGLARVGVTDGLQVVETDATGAFEMITTESAPFVYLSLPAGYAVPRNPVGTARLYQPLRPNRQGGNLEASVRFDLQPLNGSDQDHAFLLLCDIQTQDAQEMAWFHEQSVPDVQATLAALGGIHAFGVADGDIMFDDLSLYPEYERGVERMGIPCFQVVGNHDLDMSEGTDEASTHTFSRHFGPRYYSFDRGAVHYVVLDDIHWHGAGYLGYLGADQLAWLEADLARVEPGRPVIVFQHIPALGGYHARIGEGRPNVGSAVTNREVLYRLLEPFNAHILTGHTHENEHIYEHGTHEHVSGTVCGAWWSGPICWDGTPSGYSVYEIRGEEVTWRYKSTGHEANHQMRLYAPGSDPQAPTEMVANVWNWDPDWTVRWFEDGQARGVMARRIGLDPLSVELHTGTDLPPRRPWVDPRPTAHMFYAPVSPGAREVRVEATDGFGRVYSEVLRLG